MAARAGVEPTTLRLKAVDSTKAQPCPTSATMSHMVALYMMFCYKLIVTRSCTGMAVLQRQLQLVFVIIIIINTNVCKHSLATNTV